MKYCLHKLKDTNKLHGNNSRYYGKILLELFIKPACLDFYMKTRTGWRFFSRRKKYRGREIFPDKDS